MSRDKALRSPRIAGRHFGAAIHRARRPRAKHKRQAASAVPLPCVVLAVDTAGRSGWALASSDEALGFGEADTLDSAALAYIVRWANAHALVRNEPLVLVLEAPYGGPMRTVLALAGARERWLAAWRAEGLSQHRVVSVQPAEWRARVLGQRWASAPRNEVRAHEQFVASTHVAERVRADEAAAILIARWAMRAARVAAVLSPPLMAAREGKP